jgi:hypothetical protein
MRRTMAEAPDQVVDDLYGAPFGEFIARRDAAAKELRKEKRREEADAVKALRKPTLSAWAVNQLARQDRERLDGLLAAGAALRQARGGDTLRDATRDERAAVDELASSAVALLREAGEKVTEKTLSEVRDTLHAAALDDAARELIAAGRVVEVQRATGFGFPFGAPAPEAAPRRSKRARKAESGKADEDAAAARAEAEAAARAEREARRERVKAARAALREAEQELRTRERAVTAAEKALRAAQREADEAREEVERRQAEVDEAAG